MASSSIFWMNLTTGASSISSRRIAASSVNWRRVPVEEIEAFSVAGQISERVLGRPGRIFLQPAAGAWGSTTTMGPTASPGLEAIWHPWHAGWGSWRSPPKGDISLAFIRPKQSMTPVALAISLRCDGVGRYAGPRRKPQVEQRIPKVSATNRRRQGRSKILLATSC